jgi:phage host-nuclease inhibitor protein Gam
MGMKSSFLMKKTRIKKTVTDPQSIDIDLVIGQIAGFTNAERRLTADMDQRIKAIRDDYADDLASVADNINTLTALAQQWAEANPDKFAKKKSLQLTHGTLGFRTGTPKLKLLRGWSWDGVLSRLKEHGKSASFIRAKEEIAKEEILASYARNDCFDDDLKHIGLKVTQDESFYVEPNLTPVETRQTAAA